MPLEGYENTQDREEEQLKVIEDFNIDLEKDLESTETSSMRVLYFGNNIMILTYVNILICKNRHWNHG
jgi:hypothetical protein